MFWCVFPTRRVFECWLDNADRKRACWTRLCRCRFHLVVSVFSQISHWNLTRGLTKILTAEFFKKSLRHENFLYLSIDRDTDSEYLTGCTEFVASRHKINSCGNRNVNCEYHILLFAPNLIKDFQHLSVEFEFVNCLFSYMKYKIIESGTDEEVEGDLLTAIKETVERNGYGEIDTWNSIKDNKLHQNVPEILDQKRRRLLNDGRVLLSQVQNLLHVNNHLKFSYQSNLWPTISGIRINSKK